MVIVNSSNSRGALDAPGYHGPPTATLQWCEANYQFSYYIAEMANTLSNIVTIGFALYGAYLSTTQYLPPRFMIGYMGIALVGLGSGWFHATLQFQAQLADELPMIYVTSTALWLLFDQDSGFNFKSLRTRLLTVAAVIFNVLFTWSYYVNRNPVYHQVVFAGLLFTIAFRIRYLLTRSRLGTSIPAKKRREIGTLFAFGAAQFVFAFLLWNIDNIFCKPLTRWKAALGNPHFVLLELHAWWHIFTASGTYFKFIGISCAFEFPIFDFAFWTTFTDLALCLKDDHRNFALQYSRLGLPYVQRIDKRPE